MSGRTWARIDDNTSYSVVGNTVWVSTTSPAASSTIVLWAGPEAAQDATVESPVPDRDGECLVLWRHEERLKDAETRSEVRTLARKAVSKLREWPRCSEHDKALEITEVTTRGSEGKKDSVTLCCPQDGCFRHHIETFTLPAEFRRIAGPGVRFDLRGKE